MGLALLSLGIALLATTAVLLAAILGVEGRADFLVASLVLAAAAVVLDAILLSLVRELTGAALLAAQALWLAAAFALWRRDRPRPPSFRPPQARVVIESARAHPLLAVLLVVVALALALQAILALSVAPNEADTLGYHLPRAAFWLQDHSALQYNPGALNDPEQAAPPNAELLITWTMALTRSDAFAQMVQWVALLGLLAAIFSGARLAGIASRHAAFLAGLFALYPVTLLESATGQNDIVVTFFLAATVVFAVSGMRERALGRLIVAALGAGLAVGTKLDAAFALPAILLILFAAWRTERPPPRLVRQGVALALAAIVGLGSFVYVQNVAHTGTLTGFSGTLAGDFVRTNPVADAAHVAWNLLDAPGLPQPAWLARPAQHLANRLFADVKGADFPVPPRPAIRQEADADTSAYGLIGLLLVVPLVLIALVRPRTPAPLRILALAALSYFVVLTLVLGYSDEEGRLMLPAFALATPLLVMLLQLRGGALLALTLAFLTLPGTLLHDVYKPVLASKGTPSIFSLDRIGQQTIDNDLAPLGPALRRLASVVGQHDALGFLEQEGFPEYLLFGEPLQRRLVGFEPDEVTAQALRAGGLRGVFIAFANQAPCEKGRCIPNPRGLDFLPLGGAAYLVTAKPPSGARQASGRLPVGAPGDRGDDPRRALPRTPIRQPLGEARIHYLGS